MSARAWIGPCIGLWLLGCGRGAEGAGDGGLDAAGGADASFDASGEDAGLGDAGADDAAVSRDGGDALDAQLSGDAAEACPAIAALDRQCTDDSACVVVVHQSDCCGTEVATGIASSALPAFEALEPVCRASYPRCRCAARPTAADNGELVSTPGDVHAACIIRGPGRVCVSYVSMRPADGR